MVHVVGRNGDLELDALGNAQPLKADERIRDVVRPSPKISRAAALRTDCSAAASDRQGGLS